MRCLLHTLLFFACALADPQSALDNAIEFDEKVRESFLDLRNEKDAVNIVGNVSLVVKKYCSLRRYQRALGHLAVVRDAVPPPLLRLQDRYFRIKGLELLC